MEQSILARMEVPGAVYSPHDFLNLGTRAAVDQALSRLFRAGTLRKVARGLYDLPRKHRIWGALPPAPEAVAEAVARREGLRLWPAQPSGTREQVFLTDGPSRRIRAGNWEVVFRHASPRTLLRLGRPPERS